MLVALSRFVYKIYTRDYRHTKNTSPTFRHIEVDKSIEQFLRCEKKFDDRCPPVIGVLFFIQIPENVTRDRVWLEKTDLIEGGSEAKKITTKFYRKSPVYYRRERKFTPNLPTSSCC